MKLLLLFAVAGCAMAQTPDIDQIMTRVALNQAKSQDSRKEWLYTQKQVLRMIRGNGKPAREERRQYLIIPKSRRIQKELTMFEGKYQDHRREGSYKEPGYHYKDLDLDGELLDEMSNEMTDAKDSPDGIARDLFPLTTHQQLKYTFRLKGAENYRGRDVYRVAFAPKPHARPDGEDSFLWKGEALIDAEEYQPVLVNTNMASKSPMAVKILLGTNIHGLGFSVTYQKFAEGVWFPVSYGGEFDVRAVFFYQRKISVSMVNSDFKRADVTTNIAYAIEEK